MRQAGSRLLMLLVARQHVSKRQKKRLLRPKRLYMVPLLGGPEVLRRDAKRTTGRTVMVKEEILTKLRSAEEETAKRVASAKEQANEILKSARREAEERIAKAQEAARKEEEQKLATE